MTPREMEDVEDLVSKIKAGKYKCGFAAQSAILDLYAECSALRASLDKAEGEVRRLKEAVEWIINLDLGDGYSLSNMTTIDDEGLGVIIADELRRRASAG